MSYILDTNVISELISPQPDPYVAAWVADLDPQLVFLKKGIEKLSSSTRKADLDAWLNGDLLVRFHDHLLPLDIDTLLAWGTLTARLEASGKPMPAIDSLLAATAAHTGFTLVTRNVRDFEHAGIALFNPWDVEER
jgi:predicted nucleic acid-binding protein